MSDVHFFSVAVAGTASKARHLSFVLLFGMAVTACGGGGGASPSGDTTPPSVSSISPSDNSTGVAVNATVRVTFSEAMNASSMGPLSFGISGPAGPIAGGISTANNVAFTFTPSVPLNYSTTYIVTVNTGARDVAGNALAANYSARFTTAAAPDTTRPRVSATTPAKDATGVATNSIVSVTFSEPMNCASVQGAFTIIGVTGSVACNGSNTGATFTPSSALAINTTYSTSIGITAADASGNVLASPYNWTFTTAAATNTDTTSPSVTATSPANIANGILVNSTISATFSEAMNPATIDNTSFTLTGPGVTPVTGGVSYSGLTAVFTPSTALAYSTGYTASISTVAADLAGNGLASTKTWTFTTVAIGTPPDTTPPSVVSVTPADGATGIATNTVVGAAFSEPLACASVTTASFLLNNGAISGTVSCSGSLASFTPSASLSNNTDYVVTLTGGITDQAGNALAANYTWRFRTSAVLDGTPPMVLSSAPVAGASNVAIDSQLIATFDTNIDCASVTTASFLLSGAVPVIGTVNCAGANVTFTPSTALANARVHTATLTTAIKDLAGNALAVAYTWNFTTASAPDTTAPTVVSSTPANAATGVAPNAVVTVVFSEPVNCATVTTSTFSVTPTSPAGGALTGSISCSGNTASFTPNAPLNSNTTYSVSLSGITDLAAAPNLLAPNPSTFSFTTRWTKQFGTSNHDQANAVTTDGDGNVYVTGATLGALAGNSHSGGWDIFLSKYDNTGAHRWTRQLGTARDEIAYGVTTDNSGNAYITGYTDGSLDGTTVATTHDIFLVMFNGAGTRQWTRQFGTSRDEIAFGIASDGLNVYIAGYTYGDLAGTNTGSSDIFIAKYNNLGNRQWITQVGSVAEEIAYAIATDAAGVSYVTGYTFGFMADGSGAPLGAGDIFLVKFDAAGSRVWGRQYGTSTTDVARGITLDATGVYLTGSNSGSLPDSPTTNAGNLDAFVVKYAFNGALTWANQLGGTNDDYAYAITSSGTDVYITGRVLGNLPKVDSAGNNSSAGGDDLFVAKCNATTGAFVWGRQIGTSVADVANGIASSGTSLYVTGTTLGSLDGNNSLGLSDNFLLKYDVNGNKQ